MFFANCASWTLLPRLVFPNPVLASLPFPNIENVCVADPTPRRHNRNRYPTESDGMCLHVITKNRSCRISINIVTYQHNLTQLSSWSKKGCKLPHPKKTSNNSLTQILNGKDCAHASHQLPMPRTMPSLSWPHHCIYKMLQLHPMNCQTNWGH